MFQILNPVAQSDGVLRMSLTKRQINNLNKIVELAQKVLAVGEAEATKGKQGKTGKNSSAGVRHRRTSAEAAKMRADILAKRAKGVSAASLAEKYGVSTAYIYMIKD